MIHTKKGKILFGITSGIAAHKMTEVMQACVSAGHQARVIVTHHATQMVHLAELEKITGHPVYTDLFPAAFDYRQVLKEKRVDHIEAADWADLLVIAPATANMLAKLAHGLADDFLTTTALAVQSPILVCPSMNVHMWEHPAVQDNLQTLARRGVQVLPPVAGDLACGYTGIGRLTSPGAIVAEITHLLQQRQQLAGKRVVVTAGGSSEPIDGVRMITNRASGKMGVAIARECRLRGAEVVVLGAVSSPLRKGRSGGVGLSSCKFPQTPSLVKRGIFKEEEFTTADDLEALLKQYVPTADLVFHTAAVSDFTPTVNQSLCRDAKSCVSTALGKLDSSQAHTLTLTPREKIITKIKHWNPNTCLVGFKAVYGATEKEMVEEGRQKLLQSQADYVVVNDVSRSDIGFSADDNEVTIVSSRQDPVHLPKAPKRHIARQILDLLSKNL